MSQRSNQRSFIEALSRPGERVRRQDASSRSNKTPSSGGSVAPPEALKYASVSAESTQVDRASMTLNSHANRHASPHSPGDLHQTIHHTPGPRSHHLNERLFMTGDINDIRGALNLAREHMRKQQTSTAIKNKSRDFQNTARRIWSLFKRFPA